jgi:hypothetical protein
MTDVKEEILLMRKVVLFDTIIFDKQWVLIGIAFVRTLTKELTLVVLLLIYSQMTFHAKGSINEHFFRPFVIALATGCNITVEGIVWVV